MTAGEMTAGEMTAGEMTAGEMTAGEMTAGTEMMVGECTNQEDLAQLETLGGPGLDEAITGCITMCLTPNNPGCGTCLEGATSLSTACTSCFVTITECTIANCIGDCLNPSSPECAQCRENNCLDAFVECAGVEP